MLRGSWLLSVGFSGTVSPEVPIPHLEYAQQRGQRRQLHSSRSAWLLVAIAPGQGSRKSGPHECRDATAT